MPMKLKIPVGIFAAHLFDCDGTIADSMPLHYDSWVEAVSPYGIPFTHELFYAWSGIPTPKTIEMLNEKFGTRMPVEETTQVKEAAYFRALPRIRAIPEVLAEIHRHAGVLPIAVVSGSPRESVILTLRHLGIYELFPVILGAEDYPRGKPAPDPYLRAAELLGVPPNECLVYEDAVLGRESALAAGMQCVWIPPPWERGNSNPEEN